MLKNVHSVESGLIGKVFVIDPGHGGKDPGAIYFNTQEKDINLMISKNLKAKLEKKGAIVYLTRSDDYDLSNLNSLKRKKSDFDNRIMFIDSIQPNLVISIHLNAEPSNKWGGMQIFYSNDKNKKIASKLSNIIEVKRKVKKIKNVYLLNNIKYNSILIEYGFISNNSELKKLKNSNYISNLNNKISNALEYIYNC